jgi:hypothetical protein
MRSASLSPPCVRVGGGGAAAAAADAPAAGAAGAAAGACNARAQACRERERAATRARTRRRAPATNMAAALRKLQQLPRTLVRTLFDSQTRRKKRKNSQNTRRLVHFCRSLILALAGTPAPRASSTHLFGISSFDVSSASFRSFL